MDVRSTAEGGGWSVESVWLFHKKEYVISCTVRSNLLTLEVEEQLTADRWKSQFEAKHIEELTRKTGNFKKFLVFLNMLKSAVSRARESVTLDLLTYEDLEHMWDKQRASFRRRGGHQSPSSCSNKTQAKRYLILTYNVDFDRIHYPLALNYCGQPDARVLKDIIRKLQSELDAAKKQALQDYKSSSVTQLQKENAMLEENKRELEEELLSLRQELVSSKETSNSKEIQVLKKVVKNLEDDVLKEHSKFQKIITTKNEELKELLQEMEELRLSEKILRSRVKNLTNELSVYKRGPTITSTFKKATYQKKRTSSTEKRFVRGRKLSTESSASGLRLRTPSPFGSGRQGRFNPTAYVEEKRKQQLLRAQAGHKKPKVSLRSNRSRSSSLDKPHFSHRRTFSNGSDKSASVLSSQFNCRVYSRDPSTQYSKINILSRDSSTDRERNKTQQSSWLPQSQDSSIRSPRLQNVSSHSRDCSLEHVHRNYKRNGGIHSLQNNAHREGKENQLRNSKHSQEISEIDARLMALQDFMKRSLENAKV